MNAGQGTAIAASAFKVKIADAVARLMLGREKYLLFLISILIQNLITDYHLIYQQSTT